VPNFSDLADVNTDAEKMCTCPEQPHPVMWKRLPSVRR